jgi:hypothetical protein
MLLVNIFSLIFNEVLISLHRCLDSTHTNCPTERVGIQLYIIWLFLYITCFDNQGYYLGI